MFQVSTKLDYGLILLRSLALHYKEGPVSLKVIATENHLPYHYLTQIATPLRKAGFITSFEGVKGGYHLTKKPSQINLQEVSMALAPKKRLNRCLKTDHDACPLRNTCGMASWWFQFNIRFQKLIKDIKLSDLV